MCHQCQRNAKDSITVCSKVVTHRFCGTCISNWHPFHTPEEIKANCPKCLGAYNCKACLRTCMPLLFVNPTHASRSLLSASVLL
ncbi:unnamed protein product [Closterium sp. Yama58-4]|nr:unnamed protein product [Closterium sp. Yama58-4]